MVTLPMDGYPSHGWLPFPWMVNALPMVNALTQSVWFHILLLVLCLVLLTLCWSFVGPLLVLLYVIISTQHTYLSQRWLFDGWWVVGGVVGKHTTNLSIK